MLMEQTRRGPLPPLSNWLLNQGWFIGPCALAVLAAVIVASGAPPVAPPPVAAPTPQGPAPTAAPSASPLDEPLRLIEQAAHAYAEVTDYRCTLVKRERIKGQMQPEQMITFEARREPFSVHLSWQMPRTMVGQEVCYVAGKNDGKMRVHSKGIASLVGFVSIDPNDPRALENSRHSITDAGIGNLIARYKRAWEEERRLGKTKVRLANYEYNHRVCTRVECTHPEKGAPFTFYRSVVYIDQEKHLPIRVENYDWPHPGSKEGDLVEVFSFADLRLNVGLGDEVFNK